MKTQTSIILLTLSLLFSSSFALADNGHLRKAIKPTEYGYAQANVVIESSPMVYVAGQVGIHDKDPNDFNSQVDRSFEKLKNVLQSSRWLRHQ